MSGPRVIVVIKRSSYSRYIEEEGDPRAKELLRKKDPAVARWMQSHREHQISVDAVLDALDAMGARALILRRAHAAFDPADARLVVVVGGDGTLLAASHNVGSTPILGVNSAPSFSVGFFCGAKGTGIRRTLEQALEQTLPALTLTRMSVAINGRIRSNRVLNEALFCHASPAATSRYLLRHEARLEPQKSSGFWVGPAAGSTAAQRSAGGRVLPLGSEKVQLVVREPYAPAGTRYRLLRFTAAADEVIKAESMMQEARLFMDGPHRELRMTLGDVASFRSSNEPLRVLGLSRARVDRMRKRLAR